MKEYQKIQMTITPTPVHRMARMEKVLDAPPLFVKRDDLLGLLLGGHKIRKLEYILHQALADKADVLITVGKQNSNHLCLTAFLARQYNLKSILICVKNPEDEREGIRQKLNLNDLMASQLGADFRYIDNIPPEGSDPGEQHPGLVSPLTEKLISQEIETLFTDLTQKGQKPFYIPPGSSCPVGTFAMIEAFNELHAQMSDMNINSYDIFIANGTGATLAGLWPAIHLKKADVQVYGINCAASNPESEHLISKAMQALCEDIDIPVPSTDGLHIIDRFIGKGYGCSTELSQKAIKTVFENEGLLLDHTYTGKCFGGLMTLIAENRNTFKKPLVFWHTGGIPEGIEDLMDNHDGQ